MACLLYSWIIGYLRVSDRFYGTGGDVGAIAVLTSDGWQLSLASPAFYALVGICGDSVYSSF